MPLYEYFFIANEFICRKSKTVLQAFDKFKLIKKKLDMGNIDLKIYSKKEMACYFVFSDSKGFEMLPAFTFNLNAFPSLNNTSIKAM